MAAIGIFVTACDFGWRTNIISHGWKKRFVLSLVNVDLFDTDGDGWQPNHYDPDDVARMDLPMRMVIKLSVRSTGIDWEFFELNDPNGAGSQCHTRLRASGRQQFR